MSLLVNIEHSIEEINTILLALSKRHEEVNDLINKIRGNATQQIAVAQAAPVVADPAPAADPAPEAAQ